MAQANTEEQAGKESLAEKKSTYTVSVFLDWCKACGICIAFCPEGVFRADEEGRPVIDGTRQCVGCRFCEIHCPDFAITVKKRTPRRRRDDL